MKEIINELEIIPNLVTTTIVFGILALIFLIMRKTMDIIIENKVKTFCIAMFIVGMYVAFASKARIDFVDLTAIHKLTALYMQNGNN